MLFKPLALLAAIAGTTQAMSVSVRTFKAGGAYLNVGGASTTSSYGLEYKIDDGDWQTVKNEGDIAPCAFSCDDGEWSTRYNIPELNDNAIFLCTNGNCIPGNDITCKFRYGSIEVGPFDSSESDDFWGIGDSETTYCGAEDAFEVTFVKGRMVCHDALRESGMMQ